MQFVFVKMTGVCWFPLLLDDMRKFGGFISDLHFYGAATL